VQDKGRWSKDSSFHPHPPAVPWVERIKTGGRILAFVSGKVVENSEKAIKQAFVGVTYRWSSVF
jgi:hypothetical protein